MKTFLLSAISAIAIFSTVTLTSCKEDKCKSTKCAYLGVCNDNDGSCTCQTGYEGERCETETRAKFKGAWRVIEDGTASNPAQYATSIENGNNINEVLIHNFYNTLNSTLTAQVKGDTIYIPSQTIKQGEDQMTIVGKGYAVPEAYYDLHGKMILSYSVTHSDGTIDEFGLNGATNASNWTK